MRQAAAVGRRLAWILVLGVAVGVGYAVSAQTPAKPAPAKPAQTGAAAAPASELLTVSIVRIKPDLLDEWRAWQTSDVIPTLQKGGVKVRDVWQTVFGEGFEYAMVSPLENFAVRDGQSPIVKALGEQGAQAYGAKNRRFAASVRTMVIRTRPDLSYATEMKEPPKLAVISITSVVPGRVTDYENHVKTDILPLQKQAQSLGYLVSQTVFGGDGNEFASLTLFNSFADIDKGPAAIRVLGQAGAAKLATKAAGLIAHTERMVVRYNSDLSFHVGSSTSR